MIPKVLAYITRQGSHGIEVLVFRRTDHPEAGIQVPGGTVEEGEDLIQALHREIEETGLTDVRLVSQLARAPFYADWRAEWQERNVFHLEAWSTIPDAWNHVVRSGAEDRGLQFAFSWSSLDVAAQELRWGQGQWLHMVRANTLRDEQEKHSSADRPSIE